MEQSERICQYLIEEKRCSRMVATMMLDKVTKYDDIRAEFWHWLTERNYEVDEPVVVEGYSAQALVDLAPMLDGIGAFNFLVDLREQPKRALKIVKDGFKVK